MNKSEIKKDLDELEKKIEQLKVDYEKFFVGIINIEPIPLKNSIQQLIKKYAAKANQFNNVMLLFRYRNLTARFLTYQEYWNRILRLIEEGKNPKDYRKLIEEKQKPLVMVENEPQEPDKYEKLYDEYAKLLKNQKKEPPTIESFRTTLQKYEENIKTKYGVDTEANFKFEETEGSVKIKTVIKKKR